MPFLYAGAFSGGLMLLSALQFCLLCDKLE